MFITSRQVFTGEFTFRYDYSQRVTFPVAGSCFDPV